MALVTALNSGTLASEAFRRVMCLVYKRAHSAATDLSSASLTAVVGQANIGNMVRRAASIVHMKDTYYVQFSFDGHPDVDDQLRKMVHHWHLKPASTQFSQYGAWTRYFTLRFPRTLIKPQEPLRPSVPGQHILDAVPGGRGNEERAAAGQALAGRPPTSVDWDGMYDFCRASGRNLN